MPRFALDLEFDGRNFAGTQTQGSLRTVQALLAEALADLDGGQRRVRLASRLDAGVDAEHLPADVALERDWAPTVLSQALTDRLPTDLAVRRAARVAEDFDAIRHAIAKTYRYRIRLRPVRPVRDPRCWWLRRLDHPDLLQACAELLPGNRDLAGFATLRHDRSDLADPVRRIDAAAWTRSAEIDGELLEFTISGSGFLYRQVRGLVGAMAAVATGRRSLAVFAASVAGGRGAPRVGNVAPPAGLCLMAVRYDPEPDWAVAAT